MTPIGTIQRLVGATALSLLAGPAAAQTSELPPLPESIESQGVLRVATKCDYPPDGYLDVSGEHVGIEVEMAHQLAEYAFGDPDKVEFTCVTTANRVPTLVGDKVDLIIATMGVTPERGEVVAFTDPYAWGGSSVLVPADSDIQSIEDLEGGTVGLVKGSWQIPWWDENMQDTEQVRLNAVSDVLQAMSQGRVDGYGHDFAVQMGLARQNDNLRLLDDRYKIGTRAAAVRKGESDWLEYVNAALDKMAEEDLFEDWVREHVEPSLVEGKLQLWDVSKMPEQSTSS